MEKELLDKLNALCKYLHEAYAINYGGCCFVAAILAEQFERHLIPYSVYMLDSEEYYDNDAFKECLFYRDNGMTCVGLNDETCAHYFLKVGGLDVNPSNPWEYDEIELPINDSSDLFWIYETGDWNSDFDVNNCFEVERRIKRFFDENFTQKRPLCQSA